MIQFGQQFSHPRLPGQVFVPAEQHLTEQMVDHLLRRHRQSAALADVRPGRQEITAEQRQAVGFGPRPSVSFHERLLGIDPQRFGVDHGAVHVPEHRGRQLSSHVLHGRMRDRDSHDPMRNATAQDATTEASAGAVRALVEQLRSTTAIQVHDDPATRALYTMDASNHRRVPGAVAVVRAPGEVVDALQAAHELGVDVVARGGGTSLAGNACGGGLMLDLTELDRIVEVDPATRTARVQPGVILDDLRAAAAPHGLTFGPDPSTHSRCTLGGMIGNNSCGSHSVAWGTTADNVEELDVVLSDGTCLTVGAAPGPELDRRAALPGRAGQIHAALRDLVNGDLAVIRRELGRIPRQVSGYGLDRLLPENGHHVARALVGSEGTCAVVLGATVRLVEVPAARVLLVLGFPDDVAAADAVPAVLPHHPLTVEGMDERLVAIRDAKRGGRGRRPELPKGGAW